MSTAVQKDSSLERLFWATTARVHAGNLVADVKRDKFKRGNVQRFRDPQTDVLVQKLLVQERFHVPDMYSLTMNATRTIPPDGVHYTGDVYDAAAMVLLNMIAANPAMRNATCDVCGNVTGT